MVLPALGPEIDGSAPYLSGTTATAETTRTALSMGEGVLEHRPGGYVPLGDDPPIRARSAPSPLDRDAWLASLSRRG